MLTCVLGLTACEGEQQLLKHDEAVISAQCEVVYNEMSYDYSEERLTQFSEMNIDDLEELSTLLYDTFEIRVAGDVWIAGINSWIDAEEEIGDAVASGECVIDAKKDQLVVSYGIDGSIHDAYIEVLYDENLHVTSIGTNVIYSKAELMEKAGMNTLIGMGTVFVMLIVISIIISLLKYIPKIIQVFEKKETKTEVAESVDNAIAGIVEREEEATDDLELIAVIAAAIAASEGASSTDGFVVRSIKRIR